MQKVLGIKMDCDNDCLNIVVEDGEKSFCHLKTKSCFDSGNNNCLEQLGALQEHILAKRTGGSGYSKKMQENEHFSAFKVLEESYELVTSQNRVI